jgi:hypothetical protein
MVDPTCYLRRQAACDYLRNTHGVIRTRATLAKLAVIGGGPKFRKDGRFPVYSPAELDNWAAKKLSPLVSSTAELPSTKSSGEAAQ